MLLADDVGYLMTQSSEGVRNDACNDGSTANVARLGGQATDAAAAEPFPAIAGQISAVIRKVVCVGACKMDGAVGGVKRRGHWWVVLAVLGRLSLLANYAPAVQGINRVIVAL